MQTDISESKGREDAFINWIIQQHEQMDPEVKKDFLQTLKSKPGEIEKYISDSIFDWGAIAAIELKKVVCVYDCPQKIAEVMESFRTRFAEDLAGI